MSNCRIQKKIPARACRLAYTIIYHIVTYFAVVSVSLKSLIKKGSSFIRKSLEQCRLTLGKLLDRKPVISNGVSNRGPNFINLNNYIYQDFRME